jgi:predicted nucleic acid-binding protein
VVEADPDDDLCIVAAVEGDAGQIVSGDPHRLDVTTYRGITIVKPAEFVKVFD